MGDFGGKSYAWEPAPTQEEKTMALIAHIAAFAGLIIPFGNFLGPLIVWLMKKDQSPFVAKHALQEIAFQVLIFVCSIIVIILSFFCIGFFLIPFLLGAWILYTVIACMRANEGKMFEYPLVGGFVK